jgi:hypothetical protein
MREDWALVVGDKSYMGAGGRRSQCLAANCALHLSEIELV